MRPWMFVLLAVLILGSSSPVSADADLPFVVPAACPIEVPADADIECGMLVAPENYAEPDGNQVRLPYILIRANDPVPAQTPLLFTEGGPGGDSLRAVWGFADSVLAQDRDVIIFQQRGNHYADPALGCSLDELFDPETLSSPCKEKFTSAGVDLTQYHTAVIAEDIESLRTALGYEQWNLFGASYSTRVMQVLIDRHPEGVRSVILQSVSPLHETRYQHDPGHAYRALQVMFEDCAADPGCAAAYPNLEERFFDLVAELNQNPIRLDLEDPADGSRYPYQVSGRTLIDWMVGRAFYQPAHPPYPVAYYPLLIDQLADGDTSVLAPWAQNELNNEIFDPGFIAFGLYFAVNCQDDAASVTLEEIQVQAYAYPQMGGYYRHQGEWDLCQLWDLPAAPPLADGPISSEIPALVLSGRYDPITPPEWAQTVAKNLANSTYVEFPSKGHNLDIATSCAEEIKRSFLLDPSSEPEFGCLADEPPVEFILPQDTFPAAGFDRSLSDIDYGNPARGVQTFEIVTYTSNLIFVIEIAAVLVLGVIVLASRTERREKSQRLGLNVHLLAGFTALLSVAVIVLLSMINQSRDQTLELFGLIKSTPLTTALGIVIYVQMTSGLALIVLTYRAWIQRRSTRFNRIALSLVCLAAASFWPFFFRWDLVKILFWRLGG